MIAYLTNKRELKTSKRLTAKDDRGNETEYLLNVSDFDAIPLHKVAELTINGDYRGIPIVTNLKIITEGDDYNRLWGMYGPKIVPKLREIMNDIIEFVNTTPDSSNIGGGPREITFEHLERAIRDYFTDVDYITGDKVNRIRDFMLCPASTVYHDCQEGGLLRHIAKCTQILINMYHCKYQEYEVHPLSIMIAAFVHDAGKIDQYVVKPDGGYDTTEWSAYRGSHIGMGLERWARNGMKFLEDLEVAKIDQRTIFWDIWHMIGSHHGPVKNEMGSAWNPFGHDAWSLFSVDLLESRQEESIKPIRLE